MKWPAYPEYKESEVEWLREVPRDWEVKPVKRIGRIRYGLGEPPELAEDGIPFIRATDMKKGHIVLETALRVNPSEVPWGRGPQLRTGEILVVRSGAYTGDSALVTEECDG
ncbi:hypothetical protein [uncultured Thiodictyon sp.]|uniref:hypothetical protein n=1 Tax=uncultured Thiodictyon sp. TaxID=1846217 RepID=UPI0025D4886D|nr:hypothetical protein [uncultured Thiodictyon sp.]